MITGDSGSKHSGDNVVQSPDSFHSNGDELRFAIRAPQDNTSARCCDRIEIRDLLVRAILGINPDERENRQDVVINMTLETDTSPAGISDNIDDAVNYRTVTKQVIALAEESEFLLVERLAEEIARICLADKRVLRTKVSVEKPGALRFAKSVGVMIERERVDA